MWTQRKNTRRRRSSWFPTGTMCAIFWWRRFERQRVSRIELLVRSEEVERAACRTLVGSKNKAAIHPCACDEPRGGKARTASGANVAPGRRFDTLANVAEPEGPAIGAGPRMKTAVPEAHCKAQRHNASAIAIPNQPQTPRRLAPEIVAVQVFK